MKRLFLTALVLVLPFAAGAQGSKPSDVGGWTIAMDRSPDGTTACNAMFQ